MRKGFFSSSELSVANIVPTMSRCGLCGLCRKCHTPKMKPTGEGKKGVLIVAEAPGEREDLKGIQLIGSAGQELRSILRSIDVKLDRDCWKTNAVTCFVSPKVRIYTSEGYKYITNIEVGDLVLTHKGRFRKVLSRSKDLPLKLRRNHERLVDVTVAGQGRRHHKVTVTENHLFETDCGWIAAKNLNERSRIKVLGEKCIICGKVYFKSPYVFDDAQSTCSQICHNIAAAKKSGPAISRAMKKQYATGVRVGSEIVKEAHKKVGELYKDPNWGTLRNMSPEARHKTRCAVARKRQRKNGLSRHPFLIGKGESEVASYLRKTGIEFYSQYAIGSYSIDFYLPKYNLLIEIENVKKFGFTRKYRKPYYTKREKIARDIGCKIIFVRGEDPVAEIQRILKNDRHEYHFTYADVKKVVIRKQRKPMSLFCLEVEEDHSYVSIGMVSHNCHPPENSTPTNFQIDACRPNLLKTIKRLKPHTIILLGKVAVDSLIPVVWKDKSGDSLSKWAGWNIPCRKLNAWICPTYHPSYLLRSNNDVLRLLTKQHLQRAFKHTSRPYETVPEYKNQIEIVYRPSEAAKIIREMIRKKKPTAYDIETNTLKPENEGAEIVCASLCQNGDRTIAYPWSGEAVEATLELLKNSDVPKIAGNMKFEDRWARHHYRTPVKNWMWDTVLCAHVLNNTRGVTSVKFQAFVRLGIESYDDHIKPFLSETKGGRLNRIKDLDIRDLMYYCAMDSAVEFDIYLDQKAEMKRLVRSMEKNESI